MSWKLLCSTNAPTTALLVPALSAVVVASVQYGEDTSEFKAESIVVANTAVSNTVAGTTAGASTIGGAVVVRTGAAVAANPLPLRLRRFFVVQLKHSTSCEPKVK